MRNFKRYLTVLMAMLLALSMLLSSCVNQLPETPEDTTPTDSTPEGTTPPTPTECSHTGTTLVGKKDATCAAEGYTGDYVCSACGELVTEGEAIAKLAHTWDNGVQTKNPTCIEQGVLTYTCTGCGETKSTPVDCVAHDDQYHDALDGTHNITCSTCTKNENAAHVPLDTGTFVPATCLEDAYTLLSCSLCHASYKVYSTNEADKATGHTWGEWVVTDATCTEKGSKTHTCQNCPASETVEIPVDPNAHNYIRQNPDDKPTCVDGVTAHFECEYCHATKDEEIAATGRHQYVLQEDVGDGWTRQNCSVCGHEIANYDASNDTRAQVKAEDIPTDTAFEVSTQNAAIQFPQEVVSQMTGTADADVAISADVVTPEDKETVLENATNLTQEQKDRLADVEIYDFGVTVNDQPLSDKDNHFAAPVTVTMPYVLKDGEDPDGIVIWYVQDDGTIEEVAAVYDEETQTVTFAVDHFSFYAVAYKETQEMRCKRGNHLDDVLVEVIPATCAQHGYTVYQCSCCLRTTINDIVDRRAHNYGDIIPAHPTCTEGDYSTRECAECHDVLLVEYVRATGHTPDGVATCTDPSTCTTCHEVITPAKGHAFTEWTVIIEPTDVNPGLRRRYCTTCGKIEEVKIAATGNITELSFDSYQEMMEAIFVGVLNVENGIINFTCTQQGMTFDFNVTVKKEEKSFLALLEATMSAEGQVAGEVYALYRNGVLIYSNSRGNVEITNLESVCELPFDVFMDYLEQSFDLMNPMAEAYLAQAREILAQYTELYGERINNALEAVGSEYTVQELSKVLDAVETIYTYVALKLGFDTNLSMHDGVKIPTKNDIVTVIGAFMTATESEGNTTYSWNVDALMEAANAVIAWLKEYNEKALSEVIYDLIGESLKQSYPELTDWAACEAKLREMLPGTTTLQDLLDVVITALESNEICTLEEIYAVVDAIIAEQTGEEFSCEEFVAAYGAITLDELAEQIIGEEGVTMDALYDMLSQMLAETKLGTMPIPMGEDMMTLAELTMGLEQTLAMIDVDAAFSFTVDAKGNLIGLDMDGAFGVFMPDQEGNMPSESTPMISASATITRDENVTIEVPDLLKPVADQYVTATYDENGNLIISGLDGTFEYEFSIGGYDRFVMSEILTKDDAMSAELGFDVYVTDPSLWTETAPLQDLVKVGDKYYKYEYVWVSGHYEYGNAYALGEVLGGTCEDLYPTDAEPAGFYRFYDEATGEEMILPVYNTILGPAYQMDGSWMLCVHYGTHVEYDYDEANKEESRTTYYDVNEAITFESFFELVEISSVYENNNNNYGDKNGNAPVIINGVERTLLSIVLDYDGDGVDFNREFLGYMDGDQLYLVESFWVEGQSGNRLTEEVTLQTGYDRIEEYTWNAYFFDENDNLVVMSVIRVSTSKIIPTYYAKITDGVYTRLYNLIDEGKTDGVASMPTMTLPNGQTLYIKGTTTEPAYCRENGCEAAYGYVQVGPTAYAMVFCFYRGNDILDVMYYDANTTRYVSYNDVVDLDEYMTKNADGTYTVKAELFTLLKGWCNEPGDYYEIYIDGEKQIGDVTYWATYCVAKNYIPDELTFGGSHSGPTSEGLDWWYYFYGNQGDMGGYKAQVNEDGTLSITVGGQSVRVNYRVSDNYPADALLKANEALSGELGLDVRSYQTSYNTSREYVLQEGKYYTYNLFNAATHDYAENCADLIANHWRIDDLTYRYTTIPSDEYPDPMRVYDGYARFGSFSSENTMHCFFTIVDGQVYVLKQAVELGYSVLKYEDMVLASEYFASLAVEEPEYDNGYSYTTVYLNGTKVTVYSGYINVYETDENGEKLLDENGWTTAISVRVFYVVNGTEKQYIVASNSIGSYLVLGNETTLEEGYDSKNESTMECVNGTFTRVYAYYTIYEDQNFVKLAGTFYRLDDWWESYMSQRIDESEFLRNMADNVWCYAIKNADDIWECYKEITFENDAAILMSPCGTATEVEYANWVGTDANGNDVYEIGAFIFNENEIEVTEFDDGTILYTRYGDGFLMGQDGYYVPANIVYYEDGSIGADCYTLQRAVIPGYQIGVLGLLDEYITISGNTVTVDPEMLDVMADYCYEFEFIVETEYNSYYFGYYELENMFMQHGEDEQMPEGGKPEGGYVEVLPEDGKTEKAA